MVVAVVVAVVVVDRGGEVVGKVGGGIRCGLSPTLQISTSRSPGSHMQYIESSWGFVKKKIYVLIIYVLTILSPHIIFLTLSLL